MRFRAKNEERERGVQIVGTGACLRNRTRRKRGELFSLFIFPRQFFVRSLRLLAPDYPGSYCGLQREVNWQEAPLLSLVSFVCFYFLFCFFYMSFFSASYCHFLRFVVSSSPIRMTFSSLHDFCNFSCDTSCDGVWPMKSSLHASYVAQGADAEVLERKESVVFVRNLQISSRFYQSCSHGLILSSHQAFDYAELWRDRSKDGLLVAAFSLQDSWSLGKV